MKTQFITNERGEKIAVILSIKEYEKMIDELEEIEDIKDFDRSKARNEKSISFDSYLLKRKSKKAVNA
jgi:PHD/YefM family antitoxin component YafN of YafNO toxin-antitoxin module